jgi:hypothetical protein
MVFRLGKRGRLAAGLVGVIVVGMGCGRSDGDRRARSTAQGSARTTVRRPEVKRDAWRQELVAQVQAGQARAAYATWEAASPSFKVSEPRLGARVMEARAHDCLSTKAYDCVVESVELARYMDASLPSKELQAAVATELRAEARKLEREVKRATGPDRAASAAAAASVWAMWSTVTRRPQPLTARRMETIAAMDEAEAARRAAAATRESPREREMTPAYRACCKHCSKACRKGRGCAC